MSFSAGCFSQRLPLTMGENKKNRVKWTDMDISKLIDVWEGKVEELRKAKRNSHIYAEMSKCLSEVGVSVTPVEVHNKISNLTYKYRIEKRGIGPSGGSPSDWKFFERLNRFLGNYKCFDNALLKESISINESFSEFFEMNSPSTPSPSGGLFHEENVASQPIASAEQPSCETSAATPSFAANSAKKKRKVNEQILEEIKTANKLYRKELDQVENYMKSSLETDKEIARTLKEIQEGESNNRGEYLCAMQQNNDRIAGAIEGFSKALFEFAKHKD